LSPSPPSFRPPICTPFLHPCPPFRPPFRAPVLHRPFPPCLDIRSGIKHLRADDHTTTGRAS
jgi:hypothetical protein